MIHSFVERAGRAHMGSSSMCGQWAGLSLRSAQWQIGGHTNDADDQCIEWAYQGGMHSVAGCRVPLGYLRPDVHHDTPIIECAAKYHSWSRQLQHASSGHICHDLSAIVRSDLQRITRRRVHTCTRYMKEQYMHTKSARVPLQRQVQGVVGDEQQAACWPGAGACKSLGGLEEVTRHLQLSTA